jgi:hypothetical protein
VSSLSNCSSTNSTQQLSTLLLTPSPTSTNSSLLLLNNRCHVLSTYENTSLMVDHELNKFNLQSANARSGAACNSMEDISPSRKLSLPDLN